MHPPSNLKFNVFSGGMYVGKNTFCFAECAALRAVRGAKQQGKYSEFRKIQNIFPHVPLGIESPSGLSSQLRYVR